MFRELVPPCALVEIISVVHKRFYNSIHNGQPPNLLGKLSEVISENKMLHFTRGAIVLP